jgi:hypothetical protein
MGASHFFPFSTRFCRRFLELYIASSAVSKVFLARYSSVGLCMWNFYDPFAFGLQFCRFFIILTGCLKCLFCILTGCYHASCLRR